jgi:hypothetical protein
MAVDLLNRQISFVAAFFVFVGVILGVVALSTNYWTLENYVTQGTAVPTLNGTVLTSEHVDWTWNVSFILFKIDEIGIYFFRVFSINVQLVEMLVAYYIFGQQHLSFVY